MVLLKIEDSGLSSGEQKKGNREQGVGVDGQVEGVV